MSDLRAFLNERAQKASESDKPKGAALSSALTSALALGLRIMQCNQYTFEDAQRDFGFPLRTYRRHLARLRAAGMVLEAPNAPGVKTPWGIGCVRFVRVDHHRADRAQSHGND
jgi:hypothetical protein